MEPAFATYEEQLNGNSQWALQEGGLYFERRSKTFESLRSITQAINGLEIPHVAFGALAFFHHGYRFFTDTVELLVTRENLKTIREKLVGAGWLLPFANSRYLRDAETGVKIVFFTTGEFPGDDRSKPIAFPDPRDVCVEIGGLPIIALPKLIELKLTSGQRDISQVLDAIIHIHLDAEFAEQLNAYVRAKYAELWEASRLPGLSDTMPE